MISIWTESEVPASSSWFLIVLRLDQRKLRTTRANYEVIFHEGLRARLLFEAEDVAPGLDRLGVAGVE